MGKVNKRQSTKHSNHHDNPRRGKKAVIRRQHSQHVSKAAKAHVKSLQSSKSKSSNVANNTQPAKLNIPFSKWDRVLLVGEGDFSFALSLSQNYDVGSMVATCFDSKDMLQQKYPNVMETIETLTHATQSLEANGARALDHPSTEKDAETWEGFSTVPLGTDDADNLITEAPNKSPNQHTVMYGIDATKLSTSHKKDFKSHSPFTRVVFNFPHVGGLSTDVNRQVRSNQQLLVNFFNAAKPLLATVTKPAKPLSADRDDEGEDYGSDYDGYTMQQPIEHLKHGQILVTLFEGEPYSLWNIRDLARHSGLKVLESFKFPWTAYPDYKHARTIGDITTGKDRSSDGKRKGAWRGEERDARCYVLALKDDDDGRPAPGSRKRKQTEDDND